ncbi:hypothetical protein CTI14_46450, partial [Methylobacterium radiotolerans]
MPAGLPFCSLMAMSLTRRAGHTGDLERAADDAAEAAGAGLSELGLTGVAARAELRGSHLLQASGVHEPGQRDARQ